MTDDEIITLQPEDEDVVADFATLREHASRFSELFDDDETFTRMLLHGGYRELLELYDDYGGNDDNDDGEELRGYQ